MSAQPTGVGPPRGTGEDAVKRQLEALVNGECDHVAFLDAMKERFRFEPDENWEVLSLLDQYYRRGKISQDVFRAIKNGFAEYILGPQVAMPTLHTVASPAPTAPAAAAPSAASTAAAAAVQTAPAPTLTPAPTFTGTAAPAPTLTETKTPFRPTPSQTTAARADGAAPAREVRVGDVLRDRYRVEAIAARGITGIVYEVIDSYRLNLPPSGKRLAAKVPRTPDPRGNFLGDLRHEFQILQQLSHPNIVRAFDLDRDGALYFFTMELLNGVHLPHVLQSKEAEPLPRAHALTIIRDIGSAIAYAHSRSVVHGDVNPQNVVITQGGEIRLLGFGAAHKLSIAAPTPDFERVSAAPDSLRYASCEVLEGNAPTAADDIYSFSCLAYLLLKGKHPYADTTAVEARAKRLRPRRPAGLTYQQWRTLRAGLSTDPAKRPASVQAWLKAMTLSGAAEHLPAVNELIEARADNPRRLQFVAAAAAVIAALSAAGVWYSIRTERPTLPPLVSQSSEDQAAPADAPTGDAPTAAANTAAAPTSAAPTSAAQTAAAPTSAAQTSAAPTAVARAGGAAPAVSTPPNAIAPQRQPSAAATPQPVVKSTPAQATQRAAAAAVPATSAPSAPTAFATRGGMTAAATTTGAANPAASPAAAPSATARPSGPTRVEMAVETLDASPTDTAVHVTVLRKGSLRGATSFTWWTESGTAKPGIDFAPVLPHVLQMQEGESSTVLTVPLVSTVRGQPKGFYIGIESTEGGAQIGARALTQITLPPTN
jgi:serine/threonine protein kinase